jgi:hypothetical protein
MSRIQDVVLALAVTLVVIASRSIGLWGDGAPSLSSTYPLFLLVPALLGVPRILLALVYAGCFALWSKQLLRGRADIPRRSLVLLLISLLVSSYLFITNWKDGITYQGTHYVRATFSLNLVVLLLLVILLGWNRRTPNLFRSALFHFALFGWLCTYAMPYMGEAP